MEQRLSLVTLGVADLPRARRFYEGGLGWKPVNDPETQQVAFYQLPGLVLGLWSLEELSADCRSEPGTGFGGVALAHNTRSREEADGVMAEAERAGARVLKPLEATPWGGYSGYFADPDGHVWEVAHNPFCTIAEDGSTRF